MTLLLAGLALADPLPTVTVRPLPAKPIATLQAGFSKAQLIAAVGTDSTVAYHPILAVEGGVWFSTPNTFTCSVLNNMLTVSYTREGFTTVGLPEQGSCTSGDRAIPFRIEVEVPKTGL